MVRSDKEKKEANKEAKRKYRSSEKGKKKEKEYRSSEKSRKYDREWKRKWRKKPGVLDEINRKQRERRLKDPEHNRELQKNYRLKHIDEHRKRARVYHKNVAKPKFEEIKLEVLTYYSKKISKSKTPRCECCGENFSINFLALDHIEGRKNMGHKAGFTGIKIYKWIVKEEFPDGFQVLCHNCNTAKFQLGKCPHQE